MLIELDDLNLSKVDITPNTVIMVTVKNNPNKEKIVRIHEHLRSQFKDNTILVTDEDEISITVFERNPEDK